jgi:hypothetical protein
MHSIILISNLLALWGFFNCKTKSTTYYRCSIYSCSNIYHANNYNGKDHSRIKLGLITIFQLYQVNSLAGNSNQKRSLRMPRISIRSPASEFGLRAGSRLISEWQLIAGGTAQLIDPAVQTKCESRK